MTFRTKPQGMVSPDKKSYIRRMREYRFSNNLSQPEIAEKLGMRQQLYSNIETGRTKLSVKFLLNYKKLTGIDLLRDDDSGTLPNAKKILPQEPVVTEADKRKIALDNAMELIVSLKGQIALYEKMLGM